MGIFVAAAVVLFVLARLMLARSKRVFDAQAMPALQTLDKPGTWSPVGSAPKD